MNATPGVDLHRLDADSPLLHAWLTSAVRGLKDPHPVPPERTEQRRAVFSTQRLTAAVDGDQVVGTFRSWDLDLTVPGPGPGDDGPGPGAGGDPGPGAGDGSGPGAGDGPGRAGRAVRAVRAVRADAISSVTVAPTHRRRGLLTAMMTADLTAAVERGVPVAVLIASEGGIYGRFGFGVATRTATWTLDRRAARFRTGPAAEGRCEIVDPAQLRPFAPEVYRRCRTPGAIDRAGHWWDTTLGITPIPGLDAPHQVGVVHRDGDGTPDGLLLYRLESDWSDRVARTVVQVTDLLAASPAAYRGLWQYLGTLDLVATVRAEDRAVDEPLPWLLDDPRAARAVSSCDFEWSRLLDPVAALSARGYEVPGECALEVTDPHGWAAGRFLLEAGADGTGRCVRTTRAAEVTLTVQALSALWLGDGDLSAALLSGQAIEHRPGSGRRLAALLRTGRAPWTSTWF